jgi:hypothetical protein
MEPDTGKNQSGNIQADREDTIWLFGTSQENEGRSTFKLFHGDGSGKHLFFCADYSGDIIPDL